MTLTYELLVKPTRLFEEPECQRGYWNAWKLSSTGCMRWIEGGSPPVLQTFEIFALLQLSSSEPYHGEADPKLKFSIKDVLHY